MFKMYSIFQKMLTKDPSTKYYELHSMVINLLTFIRYVQSEYSSTSKYYTNAPIKRTPLRMFEYYMNDAPKIYAEEFVFNHIVKRTHVTFRIILSSV